MTRAYRFVSLVAYFVAQIAKEITQSANQVRIGLISQLLKVFEEFLKSYLHIFMVLLFQHFQYYQQEGFFLLFLPWILMTQNLLEYHLALLYNMARKLQKFSNNKHYIRLNYTLASQHLDLLHQLLLLFVSHVQSINGIHILNMTPLLFIYLFIFCIIFHLHQYHWMVLW